VELIDSKRLTQGYLEAIYILRPTTYTVECLAADFTRTPPRYAGAHVFFTPGLTDSLARKVQNSPVGRFLRRMEVQYIDLFPIESQVFTMDDPFAAEIFFNRQCHDLIHSEVQKIANNLVSVCSALGEYPTIRFLKPSKPTYEAHLLPFMVASTFQKEIDKYARNNPNFPPNENRPRSMFLILDRSIDPYAPLIHEFTYQAMAHDLLPIKDGNKFIYNSEKGTGGAEMQEGVLSEKDTEWVSLRHLHMQEAIDALTAKLEKFKKDNPHLIDSSKSSTVSDLQDMVAALPMFTEMKERFALHLQMANECMALFQSTNLAAVADVEQTCATGIASDGRRSKTVSDDLIEMLGDDEKLGPREKVRLIMLYGLYRGGLIDSDYQKIKQHANLQDVDLQVIKNLTMIGSPTVKENLKPSKADKDKMPKRYHGAATGDVYDTSRFIPGVKNIVDELIRGTLDSGEFPYTKDEPIPSIDEAEMHSSLRNPRQRAAWAKTNAYNAIKQRVFVFIVGGATYSEARSMYELSKQHSKEVILGGSSLLTPNNFLRNLSRLNAPRRQLGLPVDLPLPSVPQHLFESDRQNAPGAKSVPALSSTTIPGQRRVKDGSMKGSKSNPALNAIATPTVTSINEVGVLKEDKKKKKFGIF